MSIRRLFFTAESERLQCGFHTFEVRQILRVILHVGEFHGAGLVDDEGGALRDATHDEVRLGQELLVGHAVGFGSGVFIVGEQRQGDAGLTEQSLG